MADPVPEKATEAWLERQSFLAIARTQQDGARAIAQQHARATYAQSSSNAGFVLSSAEVDASLVTSLAIIDAAAEQTVGFARAGADFAEGSIQVALIAGESSRQAAFTSRVSAADLRAIEATTNAQVQAIRLASEIASASRIAIAAIDAEADLSEATIRSRVTTVVASARDEASILEANVRAEAQATLARIRSETTSATATHQVTATLGIADAQYDAEVGVARIRSSEELARAGIEAETIGLVAADRSRDTRLSSEHQARELRGIRSEADREEAGLSARDAASAVAVARESARARGEVSGIRSVASRSDADRSYDAATGSADTQVAAARSRYEASDQAGRYEADVSLVAAKYGAAKDREGSLLVAQSRASAEGYQSDRRYDSVVEREQGENRRLLRSLAFADERFREAWALLQSSAPAGSAAAWVRPAPATRRQSALTAAQVRAMVNRERAANDAKSAQAWLSDVADGSARGRGGAGPAALAARLSSRLVAAKESGLKSAEMTANARKRDRDAALAVAALLVEARSLANRSALEAEANAVRRRVSILADLAGVVRAATR